MVLGVVAGTVGIYFCVNCTGPASGGSLNPIVGVVNVTVVAQLRSGTGQRNFLEYLPAYLLANSLGGILAGFVCRYLIMPVVPLK